MTLRSPPPGLLGGGTTDQDVVVVSPRKQSKVLITSPRRREQLAMTSRDDDDQLPARPPKLLRSNSSKKITAASSLERALLSFKTWEAATATAPESNNKPPGMISPSAMAAGNSRSKDGGVQVQVLAADEAATKVQSVFKGHRTRRSLADCAIVVEELWWKLYDSASLDRKSISFFTEARQESAASRWVRAGKRIAKVGKGLAKDDKAQQLALRHWLEAIDPRHRYGHNLHLYYDIWFNSSSTEPFFYWLDIGSGREIHHPKCPRAKLNAQLIMYLGMNERAAYEVVVEDGRLVYMQTGLLVNTTDDSKWIFVLSTTRSLYVGQTYCKTEPKKKGQFQHSSFLAGAATSAAGRLVAKQGVLKAIWPYSGHYLPTEENFNEFISFLQENNVDLTNVKRCSVDDDEYPSLTKQKDEPSQAPLAAAAETAIVGVDMETTSSSSSRALVKWTSGAGARIGCVRDYPAELQSRALEQVHLSPNKAAPPFPLAPIPSPRPSPRIRMSPRVQYMGMPVPPQLKQPQQCLAIRTPTVHLTLPSKNRGT
ncbi:hypothetical protein EJB05_54314, partial [Eragrostis curvula]